MRPGFPPVQHRVQRSRWRSAASTHGRSLTSPPAHRIYRSTPCLASTGSNATVISMRHLGHPSADLAANLTVAYMTHQVITPRLLVHVADDANLSARMGLKLCDGAHAALPRARQLVAELQAQHADLVHDLLASDGDSDDNDGDDDMATCALGPLRRSQVAALVAEQAAEAAAKQQTRTTARSVAAAAAAAAAAVGAALAQAGYSAAYVLFCLITVLAAGGPTFTVNAHAVGLHLDKLAGHFETLALLYDLNAAQKSQYCPAPSINEGLLCLYGFGCGIRLRPGKDVAVVDFNGVLHGVAQPSSPWRLRGNFCVSVADWDEATKARGRLNRERLRLAQERALEDQNRRDRRERREQRRIQGG